MKRWTPTAEYLSVQIPEYSFVIVPLDFEEIFEAVEYGEVDFVLANSAIYIELEYLYGVDRIATLKDLWQGQAFSQFGGVIFTSKTQKDINNLVDLKNESFMAVHETSFGGWRMAQREFKDNGIDPYRNFAEIQFGGTHDKVVYAVQKGQVDAGTVRTGILEKMNEEGKIDITDFIVLNQQHPDNFSLLLSTRLYPEWPFARVKHTSDQLSQLVSIALLSMRSDSQAARVAGIAGWTIPHNYQPVHDCLQELSVSPYEDLGKITLANLIQQYWYWILVGFIVAIGLVTITIYVIRLNRKLNISTIEQKESRNRLG
ncbi:MAG: phosphate/phosphite/phosphonate ABC transporter substrate-binding protein [Armatimonadetes bacterium]|nr:phosphate/phosphite/phosphonate ABC transporter substrate-binding protein [Armatimonadota bacterium]